MLTGIIAVEGFHADVLFCVEFYVKRRTRYGQICSAEQAINLRTSPEYSLKIERLQNYIHTSCGMI